METKSTKSSFVGEVKRLVPYAFLRKHAGIRYDKKKERIVCFIPECQLRLMLRDLGCEVVGPSPRKKTKKPQRDGDVRKLQYGSFLVN
jgi:hypothetical protein